MEQAVKGGRLRYGDKGFSRSVAGSLAAHIVILILALFAYRGPREYLVPPIYTVNLIEPGGGAKSASAGAGSNPVEVQPAQKAAAQKAVSPQQKVSVKEASPPAKAAPAHRVRTEPRAKVAAKDVVALNARLKKIKEAVKEKEEDTLVESSVRRFKEKEDRRTLEQRVAEFKRGLAGQGLAKGGGGGKGGVGHGAGAESGPGGGISTGNVESKYRAYYSTIRDKVQDAWLYPEGFENKKVAIIVSVRISRSGKLLNSWVNESSGNSNFDASLMDAIKKAEPFPPLPADFEGPYLETGFRFCHPPCE